MGKTEPETRAKTPRSPTRPGFSVCDMPGRRPAATSLQAVE